jgi:hypothetical protein
MEYPVNKGAGNSVEFKGLKSQYLFVFAGGLTLRWSSSIWQAWTSGYAFLSELCPAVCWYG